MPSPTTEYERTFFERPVKSGWFPSRCLGQPLQYKTLEYSRKAYKDSEVATMANRQMGSKGIATAEGVRKKGSMGSHGGNANDHETHIRDDRKARGTGMPNIDGHMDIEDMLGLLQEIKEDTLDIFTGIDDAASEMGLLISQLFQVVSMAGFLLPSLSLHTDFMDVVTDDDSILVRIVGMDPYKCCGCEDEDGEEDDWGDEDFDGEEDW